MSELANCPHCGVNLQGEPIPEASIQRGGYGTATHFRRDIGIEIPEAYDGTLYYQCPDCSGTWHRFPEGHYLRLKAERYISPPADTQGAA